MTFRHLLLGFAVAALLISLGLMVSDDPRVAPEVPTLTPQTVAPAVPASIDTSQEKP